MLTPASQAWCSASDTHFLRMFIDTPLRSVRLGSQPNTVAQKDMDLEEMRILDVIAALSTLGISGKSPCETSSIP